MRFYVKTKSINETANFRAFKSKQNAENYAGINSKYSPSLISHKDLNEDERKLLSIFASRTVGIFNFDLREQAFIIASILGVPFPGYWMHKDPEDASLSDPLDDPHITSFEAADILTEFDCFVNKLQAKVPVIILE